MKQFTDNDDALFSASGDEEMEIKLWEYIDGIVPANEKAAIERLIAENGAWRARYHQLLEVHQLIAETELEQPSLRFSKNVMEEIAKFQIAPATKNYINKKIIWGIAAFFITVIVGFLGYAFSQVDWSSGNTVSSGIGDYLTKANYSAVFDNTFVNVFFMLNIVLGLMLLDRYLTNKKQQWQNG